MRAGTADCVSSRHFSLSSVLRMLVLWLASRGLDKGAPRLQTVAKSVSRGPLSLTVAVG